MTKNETPETIAAVTANQPRTCDMSIHPFAPPIHAQPHTLAHAHTKTLCTTTRTPSERQKGQPLIAESALVPQSLHACAQLQESTQRADVEVKQMPHSSSLPPSTCAWHLTRVTPIYARRTESW